MSANLKEVPSQTIESFIKQNGGIIKIEKHAMFAYGMKPEVFHAAIKKASAQNYQFEFDNSVICGFRYWKGK